MHLCHMCLILVCHFSSHNRWIFLNTSNYVINFPSQQIKASQVALVVRNPPANEGDIRDMGSIPGSGRSPEGGHSTHSSILAWRIPWTEELGGLQSIASQSQTQLKWLSMHAQQISTKKLFHSLQFYNLSHNTDLLEANFLKITY